MRGSLGGPRVLLRRLREVMAEPVSAQDRLDKIVVLIAANMVAEVCSVYVLRVDGTLELYATEGLNRSAVHQTVMRAGEGLVGLVAQDAKPLSLSNAQAHPAFAFKPETGEEVYHSFLGVPVLRAGNTLGVLVVQNRAHRTYSEEEIEALQTTAMVLAEMIASGELSALARPGAEPAARRSLHLSGLGLCDGIGLGHVVLHEPRVVVTNFIAEDIVREVARLDDAVDALRASIDSMLDGGDIGSVGEHRDVLETYRMFAHDRGWLHRLREAVLTGLTAEAAVERVQSDTRARMMRQSDPFLRERLHDLDDLAHRLMRQLMGRTHAPKPEGLPKDAVIVARNMSPAALLDYDRSRVRGLLLEEGGPMSHIAIVARAIGVPTVGQIPNAAGLVDPGDAIIVDGASGEVHVRPQADVQAAYAEKARLRARKQKQFAALRDKPCITRDGEHVALNINAGLLVDLPHIAETGAAGIGLFRTELQFMVAASFPRAGEQEKLYRAVLDAAGDRPVTFRTLDIGGDKVLPYMRSFDEENPALGWRAIRLGLDRPGLLRSQVRAMLKAAAGRDLRLMFPMVADVAEFVRARSIVERELTHLRRHGYLLPDQLQVGVMVEVPSLLFELDELLEHTDFVSVGTNDLIQFLYAVDRGNTRVSDRFDPLSVPVLRALKRIVDAGKAHGKTVTLCGELASQPLGAVALIALGFRSLSVSVTAVGPVKAILRQLDAGRAAGHILPWLENSGGDMQLRQRLLAFAAAESLSV
ncbi:phosphoenolpyruvate--protein phosphotransferase [Blastochloris viridis]|uniref:phosphoenolpyruvate--protein phosphotransferase n=1 Tax=Blastochloris viridis TaxID=1079 RepID=A0A0H5B8T2_BLAVI|nr:phosphoenolpyruvate--protein phosphotransferase [Blastochloris viridis]ALK08116.1 Phosphoenolpyruvate-protein phosphotransferase [Blastochloris viridis]BAR98620.1 phosphoenolpyruvate-protein phosphotransferase [Blastochloris viridis]CUU44038.1 Phosphoenolpyruvate-protein phosphotransferase [Blastochloris viridis]